MRIPVLCVLTASLLCACTPPAALRASVTGVGPGQAATNRFVGSDARWGGFVTGSRSTSAGECLQVIAFSLDTWMYRPVAPLQPGADAADAASGARGPAVFLACGAPAPTGAHGYVSALITAVGTIEPAVVAPMPAAFCANESGAGARELPCALSLPVLRISGLHTWPEPPRFNPIFPAVG